MPHHKALLEQILTEIRQFKSRGVASLVVFDLDSTLFDVGPRLERILTDFAKIPDFQKRFPDQIQHFKNIKFERRDWGIKNMLIRAGLDHHHPEFEEAVRDFWREHFFSNEYLKYDRPYAGAVKYVQSLAEAGAELAYLTGRDVHRMGTGSEQVLRDWDFPLSERAQLVLKPHRSMDDALFKKDWFNSLPVGQFAKVWFFENEPVNIRLIQECNLDIDIIFFDSTHSGKAATPENIPAIMHFLLEGHSHGEKN
jgi:hypothetical protein